MVVAADETARFQRIVVLGSDAAGAWVTGLPETVRIITVGQRLVKGGDRVVAVELGGPQS